jgi:hypothetical protein
MLQHRLWPAFPLLLAALVSAPAAERPEDELFLGILDVTPPHISTDPSVRYDYDIVYVRAQRAGDEVHKRYYTDIATPVYLELGADLMLLRPDGSEELLVEGGKGAVTDPMVSLDGEWVYYTLIHTLEGAGPWQPPVEGADIYRLHVATRRIVRLTHQEFTPNTGAADWSRNCREREEGKTHLSYGVLNFGPCPLPGGRVAFTSNRNAFRPPRGYPTVALQLFVMDDDGGNIEQIGHLNIAGALHPVILTDGRIMFSSLESQGIRSDILWGIWSIYPDGTNWAPIISAFDPGGAPNAFHFQTQLSDGSLVIEEYYNQNNSGFGAYIKLPPRSPAGSPAFGPAYQHDPRHKPLRFGRHTNGRGRWYRMPFLPAGAESLTPFSKHDEGPADPSDPADKSSPAVGKFTHPSGAPDNHLLTVWSPGPVNHQYTYLPQYDGGIYLIKDGKPIDEPGQMLLIKNDPAYNEQWPRALVPYRRIYGIAEPARLPALANDGKKSPHLPAGTPFGLVGSSSLYKRESYPNGRLPEGSVTAEYAGGSDPWRGLDAFTSHGNGMPLNWHNQGADAGLYSNGDIHAIRLLAMEPTSDRNRGPRSGRLFHNHARERLRILGEIPVRKLESGSEPLDPDGNPDTSFLAKIPADTAFTFQTLDRHGMVLNMAQTWHQLRPGEVRADCGGCHAHSQASTPFEKTAAAAPDYAVWDLVNETPLLTSRARDESGRKWDAAGAAGLRIEKRSIAQVEYFRDIQPILEQSCIACHTKREERPAGNLVLDADDEWVEIPHRGRFPGTYYRLALDEAAKFGHRPAGWPSWGYPQASRYIRSFQSRRSLLVWKVFGKRLDGFSNDDHPSEPEPGAGTLAWRREMVDLERYRARADVDYTGGPMPPPAAVEGTYEGRGGGRIRVEPLGDEDRFTLVRWIDLGCPIDLDRAPRPDGGLGFGWMADDNRPVLSLSAPRPGPNAALARLLCGMHDYYSGLDLETFSVIADFPVNGLPPGSNLAPLMEPLSQGVRELKLAEPITALPSGRITVSVKDRAGNIARIERSFSVGAERGALPLRVHVFEDYETRIEERWWLRGKPEEKEAPPSLSASLPNRRAARAAETKDFDDKMGDPERRWRAVVFNPVPGPPMAGRTRLAFRYRLEGTDELRVQIYSLTNGYHRQLLLRELPRGSWQPAVVDMTLLRRPNGSGGPLAEDERIDDIQFYVDPEAELLIDDIVLYEPAHEGETEPFPRRIIFTGWFDTGKQGAEWPGDFEIVRHEPPGTWKAVRSVLDPASGRPWIRVDLRGERPLGRETRLRFRYRLDGEGPIELVLRNPRTKEEWRAAPQSLARGHWAEARLDFDTSGKAAAAGELLFLAPAGAQLTIDDLLLYEPADRF